MRKGYGKIAAGLLALLLVAALAAGCAKPQEKVIKLGGIFDLTGATADVGVPYQEGVKDYFEYLNGKGGINGKQVKLIGQDYAYKIDQAKAIYDQLVQNEKVVAVMGWGTGDTEVMVPKITADKIPYMSASYSENLLEIATHPYNFLIAPSYSDQARAVIKWIKDNWKDASRNPRLALIYNDTGFGKSPIADAKKYAAEIGVEVVDEEIVDLRALDATSQLLNMQKKEADFAIIQETSMATATILKDAARLGLKTQFIGLNWAADEKPIALAEGKAEGYIGVIPFAFPYEDVPGLKEIKEYLASKGKKLEDKSQKYIQGWVSAKVMAEGIRLAGDNLTGEGVKKGLESIKNFDLGGAAAPVTFSADSHRGTTKMKLYQVKNGKFQPITDYISYR